MLDPTGVAVDPSGNVWINYVDNSDPLSQEDVDSAFSPQGERLDEVVLDRGVFAATPGYLLTLGSSASQIDPSLSPGDIPGLEEDGTLYAIHYRTGQLQWLTALRSAAALVDATHIYDNNTTIVGPMGGVMTFGSATFDDFAVYQNDLMVSGFSNGFEFIARLSMQDGLVTVGRVLASSSATVFGSDHPRGVAVNGQGLVLTTLPIATNGDSEAGIDVPVAFGVDFDLGTGAAPYLPLGNTGQLQARGITVDSQGDYLIGLDYGSALPADASGDTTGYIVANADLTSFEYYPMIASIVDAAGDVALSPDGHTVYESFSSAGEVDLESYTPPLPPPSSPGSLQFGASNDRATDDAGVALITVSRPHGSAGTVSVHYSTNDGTAKAGRDYTSASGTLTVGPGVVARLHALPPPDRPPPLRGRVDDGEAAQTPHDRSGHPRAEASGGTARAGCCGASHDGNSPDDRYSTAAAVVEALEPFTRPSSARPEAPLPSCLPTPPTPIGWSSPDEATAPSGQVIQLGDVSLLVEEEAPSLAGSREKAGGPPRRVGRRLRGAIASLLACALGSDGRLGRLPQPRRPFDRDETSGPGLGSVPAVRSGPPTWPRACPAATAWGPAPAPWRRGPGRLSGPGRTARPRRS